ICGMKIIRTARYLRDLKRVGATVDDVAALEQAIATDPAAGDLVPGLGGIRKIRFGIGNRGKRGGGRAIYFLIVSDDIVIMIFAYPKNAQEDLTPDQRKAALALLRGLENG